MGGTIWSSLITHKQCTSLILTHHNTDIPLISIGSGFAVLEQNIKDTYTKMALPINIICIDPNPTSYRISATPEQIGANRKAP